MAEVAERAAGCHPGDYTFVMNTLDSGIRELETDKAKYISDAVGQWGGITEIIMGYYLS